MQRLQEEFGTELATLRGRVDAFPSINARGQVEASYKYQLSDNISVAPGVIWLTAPGHDSDNSDIVVGTLRTTFEF